jgi:hypothetical protein
VREKFLAAQAAIDAATSPATLHAAHRAVWALVPPVGRRAIWAAIFRADNPDAADPQYEDAFRAAGLALATTAPLPWRCECGAWLGQNDKCETCDVAGENAGLFLEAWGPNEPLA